MYAFFASSSNATTTCNGSMSTIAKTSALGNGISCLNAHASTSTLHIHNTGLVDTTLKQPRKNVFPPFYVPVGDCFCKGAIVKKEIS
jgi:hypothetical protein